MCTGSAQLLPESALFSLGCCSVLGQGIVEPSRLGGHHKRGTGVCGCGGAQQGHPGLLVCSPQVDVTRQVKGVTFSQCLGWASGPPT